MDDNVKTPPDKKVAQSRHFKQILFACLCAIIMACLLFVVFPKRPLPGSFGYVRMQPEQITVPSPSNLANLPAGWTSYTDPDFHLSFGYPASWTFGGFEELPGEPGGGHSSRTGGYSNASGTGFFRLSNWLLHVQGTIDDAVNSYCIHLTHPCGAKPIIQKLTVAGQDARLIWPSSDSGMNLAPTDLFVVVPRSADYFSWRPLMTVCNRSSKL
jgi:hypothetical protein